MIVLVATRNRGKLEELRGLLRGTALEVRTPVELGTTIPPIEEDGTTFAENATKKAAALAKASGQWALADDSGLEVEALGGAPGIRSARFAGPAATDSANVAKLLKILRSARKRRASFRCALALAKPTGETLVAEGRLEGEISIKPLGETGFGYDPVFWLPQYKRTVAQLSFEEKQRLSHRARAVEKLIALLPSFQ